MLVFSWDTGGELPVELKGAFTDFVSAKRNLNAYILRLKNKEESKEAYYEALPPARAERLKEEKAARAAERQRVRDEVNQKSINNIFKKEDTKEGK
jgi:peptidoglycan hydrolase CwlO-like protein